MFYGCLYLNVFILQLPTYIQDWLIFHQRLFKISTCLFKHEVVHNLINSSLLTFRESVIYNDLLHYVLMYPCPAAILLTFNGEDAWLILLAPTIDPSSRSWNSIYYYLWDVGKDTWVILNFCWMLDHLLIEKFTAILF